MSRLTSPEIITLLIAVSALIAVARILGEIAKRLHQPAILGEIVAGILLGPTVLGAIAPSLYTTVFPAVGPSALALDGMTTVAIVLFLLVAGLEVDLSIVWRQGHTSLVIAAFGIVLPFGLGYTVASSFPAFAGAVPEGDTFQFALFFATTLSISALPVIAKTLMDLNLYRSELGMMIISSAIVNDIVGWIIFAVVLGLHGAGINRGADALHETSITTTIWTTLLFTAVVLTVVRPLIHRILPWLQAHASWPGGVLAFALSLALLGAAFTQSIGIHAIFGSFLVGVALGDSSHFREQTRVILDRFISFIFAPLFFASIGLRVNFLTSFDFGLVIVMIALAIFGKVAGCGIAARMGGLPWRESWAVGAGISSVGSMGIILGILGLQAGIISERLFVAIVLMAIVTSMLSGPVIQRLLQRPQRRRFTDAFSAKGFVPLLQGKDRLSVIEELVRVLPLPPSVQLERVIERVWEREQTLATGLGHALAIPHARIDNLPAPIIGIGLSRDGVDFDAPDGISAHVIFLLLTPEHDDGAQLEILADVARTFSDEILREKLMRASSYTEFLALVKSERKD